MASGTLATLTVDFVTNTAGLSTGLRKAANDSRHWSRNTKKHFSSVSAASVAAVAATTAAVSALVIKQGDALLQLQSYATLANTSVADLEAYAFATSRVGIETEKLADISKDTQDKIGDFVATGGGEFKDFFEKVAPQVGLTATELQRMSGPDALIAVKKALDDANVSAGEQVFYLESLANNAALLMPLLEDNGSALREFAERGRELNGSISDVDAQSLIDAASNTREFEIAFNSLSRQVAANFAPMINSSLESITSMVTGLRDALADDSTKSIEYLVGEFDKVSDSIEQGGRAGIKARNQYRELLALLQEYSPLQIELARNTNALSDAQERLNELQAPRNSGRSRVRKEQIEAYKQRKAVIEGEVEALQLRNAELRKQVDLEVKSAQATEPQTAKIIPEVEQTIAALKKQAETTGMGQRALALYNAEQLNAAPAQLAAINQYHDLIEAKEKDLWLDNLRVQNSAANARAFEQLQVGLQTEEQHIADSYERRRNIILDNTQAGSEQQLSLLSQLQSQFSEQMLWGLPEPQYNYDQQLLDLESFYNQRLEVIRQQYGAGSELEIELTRRAEIAKQEIQTQSHLAQVGMASDFFGTLAGLSSAYSGEQSKTYRALFAASKIFAVAESTIKIQQGLSQAWSLGFPAGIPAAATVLSQTAGIISTIKNTKMQSFDGGGFTGYGPRSGGIDGKGGFPAILHPNETVMDHTKGQGSITKITIINNGQPKTAQVQQRGGEATITLDDVEDYLDNRIQRGQGLYSTMKDTFNLTPNAL
ncbi:hypothetical protein [Marinibactrum halimedae]|uniref:Phage tail tape measure protein n=1 Tax=Marinibactrum halimedae TaxID=1444977 RepID=A0AA37T6J8_9GAMM|nr:hypothetical protein [Marinibactrum halimedae]MCD9458885.1 hypothetical protein [Marinibactrum halimedae]GLS27734.1 hypothetical protein GCM10007877_34530 [Marinibactrum halimedae]